MRNKAPNVPPIPPRSFYDSRTPAPLRLVLVLCVFIGIGLAVFAGYWLTALPVTITVNGQSIVVHTHQTTVEGVLRESGVVLSPEDTIAPGVNTALQGGLIVTIQTASPFAVDADGQTHQLLTRATDAPTILRQAGITLNKNDQIDTIGNNDLRVIRAQSVQIIDGDQAVQSLQTTAQTVSGALAQAGTALYLADAVTPALDSPIHPGMQIVIERSTPITVQIDGQLLRTRTLGKTVGEALNALGVALVGADRVDPSLDQAITPQLAIRVIRVTEAEESTQVPIPYPIVQQADTSLLPGQQRIVKPGSPGVAAIFVTVRREDGLVVSRSTPLRFVIQPPTPQLVAVSPADFPTSTASP